jgi:hypothetical protein
MRTVDAGVHIQAAPEQVWRYLIRVEDWWVPSNLDEHVSLEILGERGSLDDGTPIRIRESVAGVPCEALGYVSNIVYKEKVTWRSEEAIYRYAGLRMTVEEGFTWSLRGTNEGKELHAHVWANFPDTRFGRLFEWYAKKILRVERRDREHAMKELTFIKQQVVTNASPTTFGAPPRP